MSAHCHKCGFDLPYEGDCAHCALRSELEQARKERDEQHKEATRFRVEADERWDENQRYRDALERIAVGKDGADVYQIARDALAGDK